ncbi:MAG: HDIG domain-containing protein, partial [Bilophila sp.]
QQPTVQEYILGTALPWLETRLREGVVSDARLALPSKNGIIIRDMDTKTETLRPEVSDIQDIPALLAAFSQQLRAERTLTLHERRAIQSLFSPLLMPTLTLNREATLSRGKAVAQTVEPVYYNIQKGEIVVYQGERITKEKQLKLQSLYQKREGLIHARVVAGTFLMSLLLMLGLFMAPSGRPGTPLRRKDFYFISFLLLSFGVAAKGAYILTGKLVQPQDINLAVYFFPVAGASGLCALIFAARRYCTVGLLLSLFACTMLKGGLPLFLFFFLSAMLNTWLVIRAQNRQDVVMSIIPLIIGLVTIALGSGWLEGLRGGNGFFFLVGSIVINGLISVTILFAVSPIIEMAFGYTTRFRLMELMNLEQPLLQDLMVSIPGTYHHSLVVSNMVEAGAKAVGANSLLCKVAALYHDIGKLAYPEYYIENQFSGPNRHDKLAPAMSALILLSHVKKGSELAAQHHLGDEINDILRQHHGTGLIRYFYSKAKENGENPSMEDYCYPGPRPQSREAAIVMLADVVEASSRTLTEPTPARIKTHIDTMMKGIFADGQLDESELTFKDLHKLSENFARILTGLFHQRIVYPELTRKNESDNKPAVKRPQKPSHTRSARSRNASQHRKCLGNTARNRGRKWDTATFSAH